MVRVSKLLVLKFKQPCGFYGTRAAHSSGHATEQGRYEKFRWVDLNGNTLHRVIHSSPTLNILQKTEGCLQDDCLTSPPHTPMIRLC